MCIIITLFWIYRGFQRGLYPALAMFLIFFLALLVTLNYYDATFSLIGKVIPRTGMKWRECISFTLTYFVAFSFFGYFYLWLGADKIPIHPLADGIGGGLFGAGGGVICCGVLMIMWFHLPFAERRYPIDDSAMFFPCHKLAIRAASFVNTRISGGRPFYGERFLRDVRYGLPRIPSVGNGFFVASLPSGCRAFISIGGMGSGPRSFITQLKGYLGKSREEIRPSEMKHIGDHGNTPVFIESASDQVEIAVILEKPPAGVSGGEDAFVHDGETTILPLKIGELSVHVKVYRVSKPLGESVGTLIALFQPGDWSEVDDFLPTRECYEFDDAKMIGELMEWGLEEDDAQRIARQVHFGGKAYFLGAGAKPTVVQMIAPGRWDIFDPEEVFQP